MCLLITCLAGIQACVWGLQIIFCLDMGWEHPAMERNSVQGCSVCFGEVWANCIFLLGALKFYQADKIYFNQ